MPPNNGIIERMKSAAHTLVAMEMERNPRIENEERYRRARLSEIYAEHEGEWRRLYAEDPRVTISRLISAVSGRRVEALQVSKAKAEENLAQVKKMLAEPVDPDRNQRGLAAARAALHRPPQ